MLTFAKIDAGRVEGIYEMSTVPLSTDGLGEFVDISLLPDVKVGWIYTSDDNFEEPQIIETFRYDMTIAEWTATFTPAEWEHSENAAYQPGFVLDGVVVSDAVRQEWRQYLDVIKSNIPGPGAGQRAVDVLQPPLDNYYTFLVEQGFITEPRKAELQAGIL